MSGRLAQLTPNARELLPMHIAIIMDGNGRWAKSRNLPRVEGHRHGVKSVRNIIQVAGELGIKYLTLYTFSAENWNRPEKEVEAIMKYLAYYLKKEIRELKKHNVRLESIGQIHRLPENVQSQLSKTKLALKNNNGLTLTLALSYGSRAEIVDATRAIAEKSKTGEIDPQEIDEQLIAAHLHTRHIPDPDLLIRTSGEMRVSNFLLWQISYAELVVTSTLWPEFGRSELIAAIEEYARRHRRFGGVQT